MSEALARAESLYRRRNFRLAFELLESNLGSIGKLDQQRLSQALDLLAACAEKQGSAAKAQAFAIRCIKCNPKDLRGYLRLGKILQSDPKNLNQSIKLYQRALQKVEFYQADHREFVERQMTLCLDRLEALRRQPVLTRVDIMQVFSRDILLIIFSQLTLRELVNACLVCKNWQLFLEGEPCFWSNLVLSPSSGTHPTKPVVVSATTLIRYADRSKNLFNLDLERVFVKNPDQLVGAFSILGSRLKSLRLDFNTPVAVPLTIKMLRSLNTPFDHLRSLKLISDSPGRDLVWCLSSLPELEELELASSHHPRLVNWLPTTFEIKSLNLHSLSLIGRTGTQIIHDDIISKISTLQSLRSIELHRIIPDFWPQLSSIFANPRLIKFGFTSASTVNSILPLPNFKGNLTFLTLNDCWIEEELTRMIAYSNDDTSFPNQECLKHLKYLELKRTGTSQLSLSKLIQRFGCSDTLEMLVVHSPKMSTSPWVPLELIALHTIQFTSMGVLDEATIQWVTKSCPQLRKINLDGTSLTGPQLLTLIKLVPTLSAIKCNSIVDLSADTLAWVHHQPNVTISF